MLPASAHAVDGGVHLYLQPLPAEATRLTFVIASVSALGESGSEHPLQLNLSVIGQPDARNQRLLASGRLPIGSYAGFQFTIKQAVLKREEGEAALTVPDLPVRVDFPFAVTPRRSPLVWLSLKYPESVAGGFRFNPVFAAVMPSNPIAGHAGFVSNSGSNTITVFDKILGQAVAVIETCGGPSGMALDQRRRRLYVACATDDEVDAIDVATGSLLEQTRLSPGDRPRELALTADGLTLVVLNTGSNSVAIFDAIAMTRDERINVGSGPASVSIEPTGRRAFVFNTLSSSVSVIDLAGRRVSATVSTESSPVRGHFNRRGDRLYVTHERSPYMTVIDPRQVSIVDRARLRIAASAIAIDSVRDLVCLGGGHDTAIEFYDPNTLMPLYSMRTRPGVSRLAIDPEDNSLYIVNPETRSIAVARLRDRKVVSEIDVGDRPYWVSIMGEK